MDGQRLLLVNAGWRAAAGDTSGAKNLLEKDIRFWRMVLAAPSDLITKMVATAAVRRHFQWASMTLSQLPKERQLLVMPEQWRIPISREERSVLHTFAAEMAYFHNSVKQDANQPPSGIGEDGEPNEFDRLLKLGGWHLTRPLWKPQDAANRHAAMLLAIADEVNVEDGAFLARGLTRARAIGRKAGEDAFASWSYNPVGNVAIYIAAPSTDFTVYAVRVADLEGVRRAAVLAAQLRSEGLAPERVSSRLAGNMLRDPYTGAPFAWDAKARALVFTGLEPSPRGRHPILY